MATFRMTRPWNNMSEGRETTVRECRFELVKTVNILLESSEDTVPLEKGEAGEEPDTRGIRRRVCVLEGLEGAGGVERASGRERKRQAA